MDEQRIQAYVNLIEQLLNCLHGEEAEILNTNHELVDAGLLQVMAQVAEQLEDNGDQDIADFLHHLGSQLAEALGISETSTFADSPSPDYQQFLIKVLLATAESDGNSEIIYPLLQANLDKLDDNFIAVLQNWAKTKLSELESSVAEEIARVIGEFSNLIGDFPHGTKATNMEIAIAGYEILLTVFTHNSHQENWALIQNNLGIAYSNRISGDRAENLEKAITAYERSLQVLTYEAFPIQWAMTQNNLGTAYSDRILGSRAENLEKTIAAYEKALQVRTREALPIQWAMTQNNLGNAYNNRISGNRADNLEKAIAAYERALQVRTREAFPIEWATTQNNLGAAYSNRISGNRADNLEKAIAAYEKALQVRTREAFPIEWAMTQNNLGNAYRDRISGNRADNLEMAITSFQQALQVYTPEAFPIDWATTQNNLGNTYRDRISDNRADNLDKAIAAYERALQVRTREAFPLDWANTQNSLGNAYCDRISGDRADNLEKAIAAYERALQVLTCEAFPIDWANTQNNLGAAYSDRMLGSRADNLEKAIAAYERALQVRTREALPMDWAATQNNLGNAYCDRISGDRADNLEKAIEAFQQAFQVYIPEAFPMDWAATQNNLGNAYCDRVSGDRVDNLDKAIAAYKRALQVYTREALPIQWATTQNNLGNAYCDRKENFEKAIARDENLEKAIARDENLEKAIAAFQQALQVRTREALPMDWAMTQNNLGNAYCYRISGDREENLEKAITAYKRALQVYTLEAFPMDWAATQNNLGAVYSNRISGNRAENLDIGIAAYQQALEVYTPEADPINCLNTSRNLGSLHFTQGDWQKAIDTYEKAITAIELSRSWAITDDRRQKIMAEAIEVYQKQVQAYINIEQWDKAIETVERSKARNLVELLTNRDIYPKGDLPEQIIAQLDRLRRNIPSLERQLQVVIDQLSGNRDDKQQQQRSSLEESQKRLQQELQLSRQQLDEVLDRIKPIDSSFSLTQRVEQIAFSDIQSLIDDRTAAIEWYLTEDKILTFILTANSLHPLVEQASAEELEALGNWRNDYLSAYYQDEKKQWKTDLASNLKRLAEILNIDRLLVKIENIFDQQEEKCDRLILIPHRFLHLFPFHAMPLSNGDLLLDRFTRGVSYAPSSQLLQLTQRQQRSDFQRLFAVQNPTEDLVYSNLEVETVRRFFCPATVLAKQAACKADIKTHKDLPLAQCNHFSCHGTFNVESPLNSALILAEYNDSDPEQSDDGLFTLAEIFALNLTQSRLVTLSACETGLVEPNSFSDEYIGLSSGFLYAGTSSVVSSLWTVNDLSTAFLMIRFYQKLQKGLAVTLALNQAQLWLRDLTREELEKWIEKNQLSFNSTIAMELRRRLYRLKNEAKPFQSAYYWAAFCAIAGG